MTCSAVVVAGHIVRLQRVARCKEGMAALTIEMVGTLHVVLNNPCGRAEVLVTIVADMMHARGVPVIVQLLSSVESDSAALAVFDDGDVVHLLN